MDYIHYWSVRAQISVSQLLTWTGIGCSKYHYWKPRYGKTHEHNGSIPKDHWLDPWERQAILDYHGQHPLSGYRRLSYQMLDQNIVAVSASSVYRVLKQAGVLDRCSSKPSCKGQGFVAPQRAHQHWHVDISYINLQGTFYYLCSVLDGYSRAILHWEIRESMKEAEVEIVIERARERYS